MCRMRRRSRHPDGGRSDGGRSPGACASRPMSRRNGGTLASGVRACSATSSSRSGPHHGLDVEPVLRSGEHGLEDRQVRGGQERQLRGSERRQDRLPDDRLVEVALREEEVDRRPRAPLAPPQTHLAVAPHRGDIRIAPADSFRQQPEHRLGVLGRRRDVDVDVRGRARLFDVVGQRQRAAERMPDPARLERLLHGDDLLDQRRRVRRLGPLLSHRRGAALRRTSSSRSSRSVGTGGRPRAAGDRRGARPGSGGRSGSSPAHRHPRGTSLHERSRQRRPTRLSAAIRGSGDRPG
jgi:hypothetical protein